MCDLDSETNLPSPENTIDLLFNQISLIKKIHQEVIRAKDNEIECFINLIREYKLSSQLEIRTLKDEYENKLTQQEERYERTIRRLENTRQITNFYQEIIMTNQNINAGRDINAPIADSLRMGDNIVVNNSIVENAFNKVKSEYNADALKAVEEEINKSGNKEAAENFESFNEELSKPTPKQSILKTLWKGTLAALPSLSQFTSIISNIEKLFN
jgi:ribosomal protein S1